VHFDFQNIADSTKKRDILIKVHTSACEVTLTLLMGFKIWRIGR